MIRLEPVSAEDVAGMDDWLGRFDLLQFMSGWIPRRVRESRWTTDLCWWVFIVFEGRRVGTAWIEREGFKEQVADLGILIAEPEMRRRGIGSKVIRLMEQHARQAWSTHTVRLRVRATNLGALACYKKNGYRLVERMVREPQGLAYEMLCMEHEL